MAKPVPAISQRQLAAAAGLTPTYLSDRLRDKTALDVDDLAAIAPVLGVDPLELMQRARAKVLARRGEPAPPEGEARGPLLQSEGSYTAPITDEHAEELRRSRAHRSSQER